MTTSPRPSAKASKPVKVVRPVKAWGLINPVGLLWFETFQDRGSTVEAGITDDHKPVRVTIVPDDGTYRITRIPRKAAKGGGKHGK